MRFRRLIRSDASCNRLPIPSGIRRAASLPEIRASVGHPHDGSHPLCPIDCRRGPCPGTMDFSGATTLMTTFKTFAIYAGAVICFGGLIFAGIRMMSGRFQDAVPGLFGAPFGAGVLGWGAGWIGVDRRPAEGRTVACYKKEVYNGERNPTRVLFPCATCSSGLSRMSCSF